MTNKCVEFGSSLAIVDSMARVLLECGLSVARVWLECGGHSPVGCSALERGAAGGLQEGTGGLGGLKAGEGSSVRGGVGPSPSKPSRGTLRTAFEDILNQNLNAWSFGVKEHFKNAKLILGVYNFRSEL